MSGVVEFGDPGCDCSQAHAGSRGGGAGGGERSQDEGGCAVAQETRIDGYSIAVDPTQKMLASD